MSGAILITVANGLRKVRSCYLFGSGDLRATHKAVAAALREVRYWKARRASAELIKLPADKSTACFGMTVTLRRVDGRVQGFRIVGEDEADPARGTLSYVSPLAGAVLTHGPGEM